MLWPALVIAGIATAHCPRPERGEQANDCPWIEVAEKLQASAGRGEPLTPLIQQLLPHLATQLRDDARRIAWHELWTRARNHEPDSQRAIVDPHILATLAELAGLSLTVDDAMDEVPAGLQQTYGFLFSDSAASRPRRRQRWISGELERGLGLPVGLLGPRPPAGTLFLNVTYLFARIALADAPATTARLQRSQAVPRALRQLAIEDLAVRRLEERVRVPQVSGREITLRSDIVALAKARGAARFLVIYSIFDPGDGSARLLAGALLDAADVGRLLATETLGDEVLVSSHFDAYIEGLTDSPEPLLGSRHVVNTR